jgi:hypothetical protein
LDPLFFSETWLSWRIVKLCGQKEFLPGRDQPCPLECDLFHSKGFSIRKKGHQMIQFMITAGFIAGIWMTFLALHPGSPKNPIC